MNISNVATASGDSESSLKQGVGGREKKYEKITHDIANMSLDVERCYNVALKLTIEAGKVIAEAMNREKVVKSKTSSDDVVTETDKKVEELLINGLKAEFPDHRFIAEESCVTTYYEDPGDYEANTELPTWIIDPLDGTINFVHGYPQVCVSVALWAEGRPQLGFVYNPVLDQLFSARTGHGAFLNGRRINVSDKTGKP
ncbi:hypothetical protein B566_EDAN013464 [Ephemera danica]|nr:hypothetical protein B566_EDAN013464 [Ephemera danica]